MTHAGDLDRRVQFRRAVVTHDGLSTVESFGNLGSPVWASKRDVTDVEKARAAEVQASITTRFVVRWSSLTDGLTPKDRLACEGVDYDITGIRQLGRRDMLEITASARADT